MMNKENHSRCSKGSLIIVCVALALLSLVDVFLRSSSMLARNAVRAEELGSNYSSPRMIFQL